MQSKPGNVTAEVGWPFAKRALASLDRFLFDLTQVSPLSLHRFLVDLTQRDWLLFQTDW